VPRPARSICIVRHSHYPKDPRDRRQVDALLAAGYRVDLICLRAPGESRRERVGELELHRLPVTHERAGVGRYLFEYSAFFALATVELSRLFAERRYPVVQVSTMPDFLVFSAVVPKLFGARIVLDMHESMPELFGSKFGPSRGRALVRGLVALERASTRFADRVVAVSEPTREVLASRGVPEGKLAVVMNTPDERIFHRLEGDSRPPRSHRLLVAHGSLLEHYGFQTVVAAMPAIRAAIPDARLQIVGEGEYEPELRRLAAELGVEGEVEFLGFRPLDEMPGLVGQADIGVVPNEADYFTDLVVPTKLMELVAMGVPAVVARSKAVDHYFDESMVRFFEPGAPDDLARAVVEVARDPEEARARAERAAAGFLPAYGWRRMQKEYVRLVDELAGVR
jgi:glycosyltransferase involved in cell wall biosynthesis